MNLSGRIHPRQDLTTDQLRQLGHALQAWQEHAGAVATIDPESLASLLAGEPLAPAWVRHLNRVDQERAAEGPAPLTGKQRRQEVISWLGLDKLPKEMPTPEQLPRGTKILSREEVVADLKRFAKDRSIRFEVRRDAYDPAAVAADLRRFVAVELVEKVLVEGKDWSEL
jgi:hypothetical protein